MESKKTNLDLKKDFITTRQAAKVLGIPRRTVQRQCETGRLIAEKIDGLWHIYSVHARSVAKEKKAVERKRRKISEKQLHLFPIELEQPTT